MRSRLNTDYADYTEVTRNDFMMARGVLYGAMLVLAMTVFTGPVLASGPPAPGSQDRQVDALHRPFDDILDMYVRDGRVYYRALQIERARFDRYVTSLNVPAATYESWSREQQMAFWVNAYNAFVLQTVIGRYPITGRSADYPPNSIRQISGAFEQARHRAAGRQVTLDQIEKEILPAFKEPRLFLALGRGAEGSGRLRSEAFTSGRLEEQLDRIQSEFVAEGTMMRIDRAAGTFSLTPIVSWNAEYFVAAYDPGATGPHATRSPIERAMIAFVTPHLLPLEREFVARNEFRMTFHDMEWRLNDLTGR